MDIYLRRKLKDVIQSIPYEEFSHMQRVGKLTKILLMIISRYDKYSVSKDEFFLFDELAFYHDIGKAWVPTNILLKTEPLTPEEYEKIFMHPLYARKFLKDNLNIINDDPSVRQLLFDAAVFHHERWDGKGYPYGCEGEDIPLIARITSVCDVYDAITNRRPYREARTHKEACTEIARYSGIQFDPSIASAFLENDAVVYNAIHNESNDSCRCEI